MAKAFTPILADSLRAVHHVVHDYANLVSSGTIVTRGHNGKYLEPPMNTHTETAFLINCRKFNDFFATPLDERYMDDVLAADFVMPGTTFNLPEYVTWPKHMNQQLLHVAYARNANINVRPWDGSPSRLFLAELVAAWKVMRANLQPQFVNKFADEIALKAKSPEYSGLDLE